MIRKLLLATALAALMAPPVAGAGAGSGPVFGPNTEASLPQGSPGWDEPSGATGSDGALYASAQNAPGDGATTVGLNRSADGVHWTKTGLEAWLQAGNPPLGDNFGDVTMTADRNGTVFLGFIDQVLQAEISYTRDGGKTWAAATDVAQLPAAPSSSPAAVDRPWIAAYSPDSNWQDTKVFLEYHDFVPSIVWVVTCSMSGGALACGAPVPTSDPNSFCNTIPGGVAVAPAGSAHPGRVYAVWSSADPQTNLLSGCNITQLAPFYSIYVSWSDTPDQPGSWNVEKVYTGPNGAGENCTDTALVAGTATATCADASELFTQIAADNAGNPYVAFVDYIDTLDKRYDVYLAASPDGGVTWDGKTDGTGLPHRVSAAGGTHFMPVITAGDAGRVDIAYLGTAYATAPFQDGDTCPSGTPPENPCGGKAKPEPASAAWYVYLSQSLNADTASPTFTEVRVSDPGVVIHYGDVCNLGIYCDGSAAGNRSLWDTISLIADLKGNAVVEWTDQRADAHALADAGQSNAQSLQAATDQIWAARQVSGPTLLAVQAAAKTAPFTRGEPAPSPAVPLALIALGGLLIAFAGERVYRARK